LNAHTEHYPSAGYSYKVYPEGAQVIKELLDDVNAAAGYDPEDSNASSPWWLFDDPDVLAKWLRKIETRLSPLPKAKWLGTRVRITQWTAGPPGEDPHGSVLLVHRRERAWYLINYEVGLMSVLGKRHHFRLPPRVKEGRECQTMSLMIDEEQATEMVTRFLHNKGIRVSTSANRHMNAEERNAK